MKQCVARFRCGTVRQREGIRIESLALSEFDRQWILFCKRRWHMRMPGIVKVHSLCWAVTRAVVTLGRAARFEAKIRRNGHISEFHFTCR